MDPRPVEAPCPATEALEEPPSILVVVPASPGSRQGNRTTAQRWASILRDLGCQVAIKESYEGGAYDLLVSLHASKSAASVRRFFEERPGYPIVLALTGTDIYPDCPCDREAGEAMATATRLITLEPLSVRQLSEGLRGKTRVIFQSAPALSRPAHDPDIFEVCVLGNLRQVKDPLLGARAVRLLPEAMGIHISHVGFAVEHGMALAARKEEQDNPRYQWLGGKPHGVAMQILGKSRLLLNTSRHEGATGALSEALAMGVPALVSSTPGNLGVLGEDYPGVFPCADPQALADQFSRILQEDGFAANLAAHCRTAAEQVRPEREQRAWCDLLGELFLPPPAAGDLTPPSTGTP